MKEIIFSSGQPVFSGPAMMPDPILARWSAAQAAYEEDCRRCPRYPDGAPRKSWHALDPVMQDSWYRNPTPREYLAA